MGLGRGERLANPFTFVDDWGRDQGEETKGKSGWVFVRGWVAEGKRRGDDWETAEETIEEESAEETIEEEPRRLEEELGFFEI